MIHLETEVVNPNEGYQNSTPTIGSRNKTLKQFDKHHILVKQINLCIWITLTNLSYTRHKGQYTHFTAY